MQRNMQPPKPEKPKTVLIRDTNSILPLVVGLLLAIVVVMVVKIAL